jgi:hypothetical protein
MIQISCCTRALRGGAPVRTVLSGFTLCAALLCAGTITGYASASGLTIAGRPASAIVAGNSYTFTPSVTDSRTGRKLTFAIANKPSWAYFNTSSGKIEGVPRSTGVYRNIVISVNDGISAVSLSAFAVTVTVDPLKISGSPASSVSVGSAYSFTPTVSDSRTGYARSFTIISKPSWATFDSKTGKLSGTPPAASVGLYPYVAIEVYDGIGSALLGPFSISVTGAAATGQATLKWIDPTETTNGRALTDFAGVRIYYGPSASNLSELTPVAGTAVTSYTVNNLKRGTWYFGLTSYTVTGVESSLSAIVSKTVQ